jgi:hypothetical protein
VKPEIPPGPSLIQAIERDMNRWLGTLREHEQFLPAAGWVASPLWKEARWWGTAYQFDRHADSPPVMALIFENSDKGRELFKSWTEKNGNCDELEEIRITFVEGKIPGVKPGYWVHIGPDPENSLARATAEGISLDAAPLALMGLIRRMDVADETEPMLPRFKDLFTKHGEFLFAPACPRHDGRHWVDLQCGIVKRAIHFQRIEDFGETSAEH